MAAGSSKAVAALYEDFLRVCQKWPTNASRRGRDLGEYYRCFFDKLFKEDVKDVAYLERQVNALTRLSSDYFKTKYPRKRVIGYTTSSADDIDRVMSNDAQTFLKYKNKTWWQWLTNQKSITEQVEDRLQKK